MGSVPTDSPNLETRSPKYIDTNSQLCLPSLLGRTAKKYSDKTAIICGDATLTFGELSSLSSRLATALLRQGVRHGDLVGVALDRSVELVAMLLAVLMAGAAYIPIDTAIPPERMNQMVDDASPKLLIISPGLAGPRGTVCLTIDQLLARTTSDIPSDILANVKPDDLAYVIYTSGSTGRPKGVEITHANVANLLLSMKSSPGCTPTDILLAITTVSFDMAVVELFLPLLCGATLVLAQRQQVRDPASLVRLMDRYAVTIMQGTPAIWQMLLHAGWDGRPRVGKIFCGGEAMSRALADQLLGCGDQVWNMYGPTEVTVYASIWRVHPDEEVVIGDPVVGAHLYILDENLNTVPVGTPGELCVGGAGVAKGYRNNPELSRSRFVDNPFHPGMMYRTGDLARITTPGKLVVMGRMDSQVKIRGYRIELGDVEAAITQHEDISAATVMCRDDRLVAYCVRRMAGHGVLAMDGVLRPWLAERLPDYMVPAFFVEMESLPVTINGKIDRKALPDPVATTNVTKPTTDLEGRILGIWSKVLGHDRIGTEDNFFDLGGDSVRVIRVQKELERALGHSIPVQILFEHFTIRSLEAYLKSSYNSEPNQSPSQDRPQDSQQDIAIISVACRLPGATTPEEFWHLLDRGDDAVTKVPPDRWDADAIFSTDPNTPGKSYCHHGGFLASITSFDTSFFGISPREASSLDPAQYLMLETCFEGFERAGYTMDRLRGSQTGVFIGTSNILSHQGLNSTAVQNLDDINGYTVTGSAGGTMSGRISYHFGLHGPAMTVDTACSSSLVATHLACNALRQIECEMAVAGGISLLQNTGLHVEFSRLQGLSPDGRCRAFSEDANGTGWSEGVVVVVLKRLVDAQRDGDFIHGVIRGTAVNHDGRSATLTTPSGTAQQRLVRSALSMAGLKPGDIDYVEAHGTGTKLGDPIEAAALAGVFGSEREWPLLIGSAKSNIGHTQAAAGLAGLLKVVLAMQYNTLPRTLHVTEPTAAVEWKAANMTPVLEKQPWLARNGRLRRAGVSAFGIGGTNAHVVVEEPPGAVVPLNQGKTASTVIPFLLSGDTDEALRAQAKKLYQYVNMADEDGLNVAYSLATSRSYFRRRLVLLARDKSELIQQLESTIHVEPFLSSVGVAIPDTPKLAMLFTGQGSQHPGMGRDLCKVYPLFDKTIHEIAAEFDKLLGIPLLDVMWSDRKPALLLDRTDYAQPALFTLELALFRLWQSWGVTPDFVMGHSLGEIVAAHVASVLNLADACRLVVARGRLMQGRSGDYSMVSVEAGADEVAAALHGDVDIAAYNTPRQTVISGSTECVKEIGNHFGGRGRKTKTLLHGYAFHSRHMDGILEDFLEVVNTVQFHSPKIPIVGALTGSLATSGQLTANYWVKQIREPVRFDQGIQELARHGTNVFLEIGPHPVLSGMGAECLPDKHSFGWLPSLMRGRDGPLMLQNSLAQLHIRHARIDWQAYFEPFGSRRVRLPTYAFQRTFQRQDSRATTTPDDLNARTPGDTRRFEFEVAWHALKTDYKPTLYADKTWGLVSASDACADLISAISKAGIQIVQVEDLDQAEKLDGLLCLWDSDTDLVSQARDWMTKALPQLQTAARISFTRPIIWVTRRAVGTGAAHDKEIRPGAAVLWGLMRTARNEHPELRLRLVDLEKLTPDGIISALFTDEPECVVREDRVFVPRMQRISSVSPSASRHKLIRPDGAVLITGGLGHLGAHLARWLAKDHGVRHLILTSRQGMHSLGAETLLSELSRLDIKVTVLAGNIADPDFVTTLMTKFSSSLPLRGVIHAAGVVDSGVLSTMTPARCETTLSPKVFGAWNLHLATKTMDLDMFVMISSVSGVMGMTGLANYAAANTFLDALAHLRRGNGFSGTSVAYGTWAGDGGMAARLGSATRSHLASFGLGPLQPDEGLEMLGRAVVSERALTVAAAFNIKRLRGFWEEQGGIPPFLSLLLPENSSVAQTPSRKNLRDILTTAKSEDHDGIVLDMVRNVVAKALGFTRSEDVEVNRPLKDIGIDSLTAVQMRNHLATLTGLTLSVNIALLHPNLRALSKALLSQVEEFSLILPSRDTITPGLDMASLVKGCLDSTITFDTQPFPLQPPNSVLLTGATGFVGAFILSELLRRGIPTHCLVRTPTTSAAQDRIISTLESYSLWDPTFLPLLKCIPGDISQPHLGLSSTVFSELANTVSAICHSAALVDWMRPLEEYTGPNILSAHEILRLAACGLPKTVHLVSTMSTLPLHMGLPLNENNLEYGYGTSKFLAERLVAAARWRGASAVVYRLPYATASSTTGHFRRDRGDFLHNLVVGGLEMGAFPVLEADMSAVLPVDYLAGTIVSVMIRDFARAGKDYDFQNRNAISCTRFFDMVAQTGGKPVAMMPFGEWKSRASEYARLHPKSSLARIAAVLDTYTDETAVAMFGGATVGQHVFGGEEYPAPKLDEGFVMRYMKCIGLSGKKTEE